MDLTPILAILKAAGSALAGTAAQQFLQVTEALIENLPAIEKGYVSAEPFIAGLLKVIGNGGQPLAAGDWDTQVAMLKQQTDTVAAQIAADAAS